MSQKPPQSLFVRPPRTTGLVVSLIGATDSMLNVDDDIDAVFLCPGGTYTRHPDGTYEVIIYNAARTSYVKTVLQRQGFTIVREA